MLQQDQPANNQQKKKKKEEKRFNITIWTQIWLNKEKWILRGKVVSSNEIEPHVNVILAGGADEHNYVANSVIIIDFYLNEAVIKCCRTVFFTRTSLIQTLMWSDNLIRTESKTWSTDCMPIPLNWYVTPFLSHNSYVYMCSHYPLV